MKTGKVSESVLKRSVLREINQSVHNGSGQDSVKQEIDVKGAGIGTDCAFLMYGGSSTALSVQPFCLDNNAGIDHAVIAAVNNVAAGGAQPVGILLSVLLPSESEEKDIQDIMKQVRVTCKKCSVRIMGGHTEVTDGVTRPVVTAVGIGWNQVKRPSPQNARSGQDIVASKWIGLEGTSLIAHALEQKLADRLPSELIAEAKGYNRCLSILPEAACAAKAGVTVMHDARNGGIFGALWEFAEREGVGIRVDLKKIPVKQETIEVCELVDVNPYELLAGGMLLMLTDRGEELTDTLKVAGIPAAVIGQTTDKRDRIVTNGGEIRFLNPPGRDEIYRILSANY